MQALKNKSKYIKMPNKWRTIKAVVNIEGGLLASRRVFSWLPLGFFCSYSTDSD